MPRLTNRQWNWIVNWPVERYDDEGENAWRHGDIGHEVVDRAVNRTERPIRVEHVDEIEYAVEHRHHQIRHR